MQRTPADDFPAITSGPRIARPDRRRRGSTMLIVISLMGLLALLGFIFYTFAAQEQLNANIYVEAAKTDRADVDFFDFAMEQLIVGPRDDQGNSALWGKRHSLIPNMLGFDAHPHNGRGVNLINGGVDQNPVDGVVDPIVSGPAPGANDKNINPVTGAVVGNGIHDLLEFNDSPVAWGGRMRPDYAQIANPAVSIIPAPDVDYTYPDINNIFLAYRGPIVGYPGTVAIIPSFHRPQILRAGGAAIPNWATNPLTAAAVMRPHPNHIHQRLQTSPPTPTRLYLDANNPLDAAIIAALPGGSGGFPFQVNDDGDGTSNEQGAWSPPYAPAPNQVHEFDVDNDREGGGQKEGIWINLGFPVLEKPGTTHKYVPLFSFTIYDADALFNLNAHGNVHRNITSFSTPFGGGRYVSRSNYGLGPHEVNPAWGLNADPRGNDHNAATAADNIPSVEFTQHNRMFGSADPVDHIDLGNRELFWLTSGRGQLPSPAPAAPTDVYPGRYGEADVLYSWLSGAAGSTYPKAGHSLYPSQTQLADDNRNRFDGEGGTLDPTNLPFGQPMDWTGFGRFAFTEDMNGNGVLDPGEDEPPFNGVLDSSPKRPNLRTIAGLGNPSRWLAYLGYRPLPMFLGGTYDTTIPWPLTADSTSTLRFPLADDPLELMMEPTRALKPYDEIFSAEEMALLHLSDTLAGQYAAGSRLLNLAPVNFSTTLASTQAQLAELRKRFTTLSWNRKNFGFPASTLRTWEYNLPYSDTDGDGLREFPPVYSLAEAAKQLLDPSRVFRHELRRLLTVEFNNQSQTFPQMRASINGVLDVERQPGRPVDRMKGPLQFRQLTPHPSGLSNNVVPTAWNNQNPAPYPPTSVAEQEWWARYDRQVMARDIYVLLYTLGSGSNAVTPNGSNNGLNNGNGKKKGIKKRQYIRQIYTDERLEQMAQFAVNLVDALDRDNIITAFEYDVNLGNGWDLDDNSATATAAEVPPGVNDPPRRVVFGIESASLTFSEALAVFAKKVTPPGAGVNHAATEWNDTDDRYFTYIELRNASPFPVDFSNGQWEIWVQADVDNEDYTTFPPGNPKERRLRLLGPAGVVTPGGLFTIGSTGDNTSVTDTQGTNNPYSIMKVDPAWMSGMPTLQKIAPAVGNLDLDLIRDTTGPARFQMRDGQAPEDASGGNLTTALGSLLNASSIGSGNNDPNKPLELVLVRRQNLGRQMPTSTIEAADNPWVIVDRTRLPGLQRFELAASSTATIAPTIPAQLAELTSGQRAEPLMAGKNGTSYFEEPPFAPAGNVSNSLGGNNTDPLGVVNSFAVWQAHFDREFASVGELLNIPLFGPATMTLDSFTGQKPLAVRAADVDSSNDDPLFASDLFLLPDHPDSIASDANGDGAVNQTDLEMLDNRWYRLFEFVEVPSRTHRGLSPEFNNPLNVIRQPGQVNLNTLRHPEVLAGLIDDREVCRNYEADFNGNGLVDPNEDLNGNGIFDTTWFPGLPDAMLEPARNWWSQLVGSRDGVSLVPGGPSGTDPVSGLLLPGVAGSHPFRSLSFLNVGASGGIEHTFLRSLPLDGGPTGRRLFELANAGEYGAGTINPYIRHRILSKMLNNTSTRSNVFIVYVTVGFFEANLNTTTGEVRIGGEVAFDVSGDGIVGNDRKWGFFVIDRSLAEEAFDPGTGTFANWRQLIKYQLKP